jgi:DNA-nicking Smr family endonuclease
MDTIKPLESTTMSDREYTTAAQLPLHRITDPECRRLAMQFVARYTSGRTGAALMARLGRAA